MYYQLYTDKGVYVPKYGEENIRKEMEVIRNLDINISEEEVRKTFGTLP